MVEANNVDEEGFAYETKPTNDHEKDVSNEFEDLNGVLNELYFGCTQHT